ncbi:MAG: purine-nucleoside phosphorylase [Thermodesulfobacteriota bacterium]
MKDIDSNLLQTVKERLPLEFLPETAVVLGTGLGHWVDGLDNLSAVPYFELPGFPESTVESHKGRLVHGWVGSLPVLALQGRFHLYEGYTAEEISMGIRLLARLGISNVIFTNAAGSVNPLFQTGSIMVIADHINHTGQNPLLGKNIDHWGPRFPDMSRTYDLSLRQTALETGGELGIRLEQGVYLAVLGPSLETPAETRAYKMWGADAIGMSTVLEAITAKHMGLKILGLSCLTNQNLPDCMAETTLQEIICRAEKTGRDLSRLLTALIPKIQAG